jgi:hypothetical protein
LVENFSMSLHATMRAFGSLVATMFSGGPAPAAAVVVEAPAPAPAAKVEAVQVEASTPRAGIQTAATPEASAESEERSDET